MTTDFRALCAELLQGLDENRHPEVRYPGHLRLVMDRARTALAEGDGVGPTDEELETLVIAIQALVPIVDDGTHLLEAVDKGRDILRRALHNYGTTHPRPIPVAERLPTAADCDAEGRCWGWDRYAQTWRLAKPSVMANNWGLFSWLPAAAIPLPEASP